MSNATDVGPSIVRTFLDYFDGKLAFQNSFRFDGLLLNSKGCRDSKVDRGHMSSSL